MLGEKILKIRKEAGLSQQQFAEKFHVTRQTVSNWENDRNYPDMTSLKRISEEFGVSFDILLKDDALYIDNIDKTIRKATALKRVLLIIGLSMISLILLLFLTLHEASKPTPDGKRINTDTDIRMLTFLEGETPSRAITYTTTVGNDTDSIKAQAEKHKNAVLGNVEGDIPAVYLDSDPVVALHFQDTDYHNISPDNVSEVTAVFYDLNSDDAAPITTEPEYTLKAGAVMIELDPDSLPAQITGEETFCNCVITIRYSYQGKTYLSTTAVNVFDTKQGVLHRFISVICNINVINFYFLRVYNMLFMLDDLQTDFYSANMQSLYNLLKKVCIPHI